MARCHICDSYMDTVELDLDYKILPCDVCQDTIKTVVSEDEVCDLFLELGYTLDESE